MWRMNAAAPAGIYPMQYAFFDASGALDRAAMRRQTAAAVRNGAHGVAVLGLATKVHKLSDTERRTLLDWVLEEIGGCVPVAATGTGARVAAQV